MRAGEKPRNQGLRGVSNKASCLRVKSIVKKHKSAVKNQGAFSITTLFLSIAIISLLTITISILTRPAIAETTTTTSYCYFPTGDDYTCYTSDTYSGSDFTAFCQNNNGSLVTASSPPPQCTIGCCNTDSSLTTPENPVSKYYCENEIEGEFVPVSEAELTDDLDCIGYINNNPFYNITIYYNISGVVKGVFENSATTTDEEPAPLDSVTIHYPSGDSIIKTITGSDGKFLLTNIPGGEVSIYFERPGCISQEKLVNLNETIDNLDIIMNCPGTTCESMPVSEATALPTIGKREVKISWDNPGLCDGTKGYNIYRCLGFDSNSESCELIGFVSQENTEEYTFTDDQVPVIGEGAYSLENPDALFNKVCYKINAITINNEEIPYGTSNEDQDSQEASVTDGEGPNCITPFMDECLTGDKNNLEEFCIYQEEPLVAVVDGNLETVDNPNGLFLCEGNTLFKNDDCDSREVCYDGSCVDPSICELCNGVFGFFIKPLCDYYGCYLDSQKNSYEEYDHCGFVSSCYDYNTEDACLKNPCGVDLITSNEDNAGDSTTGTEPETTATVDDSNGCEWVPKTSSDYYDSLPETLLSSMSYSRELGMGICRPVDPSLADCEACNFLTNRPSCDETGCELIGDYSGRSLCLFKNDNCQSASQTACSDYSTYEECTGGSELSVNTVYEGSLRVGGDNTIQSRSNDLLGIGLCRWLPSDPENGVEGRCIKDADGDFLDDCEERPLSNNDDCGLDHQPPNTTVQIADQSYLTEDELSKLSFVVTDDRSDQTLIKTYACMVKVTDDDLDPVCYPENSPDYLWPNQLSINDSALGTYKIFYYSEDGAGNLEPVKELTVHVTQLIRGELERASVINNE